jgi:hypothetical protein
MQQKTVSITDLVETTQEDEGASKLGEHEGTAGAQDTADCKGQRDSFITYKVEKSSRTKHTVARTH